MDLLPAVLKKYNNRVHGTTGMSPHDARTDENNIKVYMNIRKHAQYKISYPKLSGGDLVRTAIKTHIAKGHQSAWPKEVYKNNAFIKDNQYLINDHRRRVWNRWELLKIEGSQGKDG